MAIKIPSSLMENLYTVLDLFKFIFYLFVWCDHRHERSLQKDLLVTDVLTT